MPSKARKVLANRYWVYGKHPNPTTWHETADILRDTQKAPSKSGSGISLHDRLDTIEQLLKEKK